MALDDIQHLGSGDSSRNQRNPSDPPGAATHWASGWPVSAPPACAGSALSADLRGHTLARYHQTPVQHDDRLTHTTRSSGQGTGRARRFKGVPFPVS